MGSMSNPNPWSPYDSYNDCSQGVCNIYCPQWCYLIFPPPPPPFFLDDDSSSSSSSFSPLLIALIGILVTALILVSYYTLISKYCRRRRETSSSSEASRQGNSNAPVGDGLNDSLIKSITVYKYRKGDGHVDGSDCSVCLSEFEDNESLRLLPKCNHAFHLPCIDTWLRSHSNCPLCRAYVTGVNPTAVANQSSSVHPIPEESVNHGGGTVAGYQHQTGDFVVVIEDLEIGSRDCDERSESQQPPEEQGDGKDEDDRQVVRRSVSLNSGTVVSIADVLREIEDEEGDDLPPPRATAGVNQMKRSVSTGRFIFSRYDRGRNYSLPN